VEGKRIQIFRPRSANKPKSVDREKGGFTTAERGVPKGEHGKTEFTEKGFKRVRKAEYLGQTIV